MMQNNVEKQINTLVGFDEFKDLCHEVKTAHLTNNNTGFLNYIFSGGDYDTNIELVKMFGAFLKELGVLQKGHVVEVKYDNVYCEPVYETAFEAASFYDTALDGILYFPDPNMIFEQSREANNDCAKLAFDGLSLFLDEDVQNHRVCIIFSGERVAAEKLLRYCFGECVGKTVSIVDTLVTVDCPVCRAHCLATATACPVCGFTDINIQFVSREDAEEWRTRTLEPCRAVYNKLKKHLDKKLDSVLDRIEIPERN